VLNAIMVLVYKPQSVILMKRVMREKLLQLSHCLGLTTVKAEPTKAVIGNMNF
jgi:hypothetical protein